MLALATGMGLGFSPLAPGTVGSVWGILVVVLIYPRLALTGQLLLAIMLTAFALPICDVAEKHFGRKDPPCVVADEYLTFPLCMIGLPVTWSAWWVLPMAFLSNRLFDIVKLPPAHQLQRMPGGLGVVLDDVVAALYSLAANHFVYRLLSRWPGS